MIGTLKHVKGFHFQRLPERRLMASNSPVYVRVVEDDFLSRLQAVNVVEDAGYMGEHRSCKIRRLLDSSSFSYCWQAHSSVGRLDILCQRSLRTTQKALSRYRRRWSPRSRH